MNEQTRAKRTARRWAKDNGHALDKWSIEAGRPVAMCGCGGYAFVMPEGSSRWVYGSGRLPIPGAVFMGDRCPLAETD